MALAQPFRAPRQQRLQRTSEPRAGRGEHTCGPAHQPEDPANQEGKVFGGGRFGESHEGVGEVAV